MLPPLWNPPSRSKLPSISDIYGNLQLISTNFSEISLLYLGDEYKVKTNVEKYVTLPGQPTPYSKTLDFSRKLRAKKSKGLKQD